MASEVEYIKLSLDENNDIVKETVCTEQIVSTCATERKKSWQTIYEQYGSVIDAGVTFDGLIGAYMEPIAVRRIERWQENETDMRVTYVVEYNYHTLFKVNTSTSGYIGYVATNDSTLTYYADELLAAGEIPNGHRVEMVYTTSPIARITNNAVLENTTIVLDYTNKDEIVPITFSLCQISRVRHAIIRRNKKEQKRKRTKKMSKPRGYDPPTSWTYSITIFRLHYYYTLYFRKSQ